MKTRIAIAMTLPMLMAAIADAQIVSGVMTVTGAEMHWWAGVACDATARLYDVDEDSVVFTKLNKTKGYDQGTVKFRARKGKLIDLDKLHESVWATRLSGRTRSGLVTLQVTTIGRVVKTGDQTLLKVAGSDAEFILAKHDDEKYAAKFGALDSLTDQGAVKVTGVIGDYRGRWPGVLRGKPKKPRRILVTDLNVEKVE